MTLGDWIFLMLLALGVLIVAGMVADRGSRPVNAPNPRNMAHQIDPDNPVRDTEAMNEWFDHYRA